MKVKSESEVAQSCPTLSDPMDCSLPGSSVHGIFQARVLEWVDVLLSQTLKSCGRRTFKKHTQQLKNSGKQCKLCHKSANGYVFFLKDMNGNEFRGGPQPHHLAHLTFINSFGPSNIPWYRSILYMCKKD